MVGDHIFTDILGANVAGVTPLHVKHTPVSYTHLTLPTIQLV